MEKISIKTTQNVAIEHKLASVGERIAAHVLDYLFFTGYFIICMIMISNVSGRITLIILLALPLLLYDLICEYMMEGQSWGKKIIKIKVIKMDGTRLGFFSCFIRWMFRIIDNVFLFGGISSLVIIVNGRGQRLGDLVANTTVVRINKNQMNETILTELPENYKITFHEAINLNSSDIYTLKEALEFCAKYHYIGKAAKLAFSAKESVEKKLGIKSDLVPGVFLNTVVMDYTALHNQNIGDTPMESKF